MVVRGVVERERSLQLAARLRRQIDQRDPHVQLQWDGSRRLRLVKVPQPGRADPAFKALVHDQSIVDVVEELIGPGALLYRDVVVGKPAGSGGELSEHQDSAYWDVHPPALVSAWVALTDVPSDRSPLQVVPGSHRSLLPHGLILGKRYTLPQPVVSALRAAISAAGTGDNPGAAGGSQMLWNLKKFLLTAATRALPILGDLQDYRVLPSALRDARRVSLPIRAGDVVFFHSLTVHGSPPNSSAEDRYAHIISYMPAHAQFVGRGSAAFQPARRAADA